MTSTCETLSCIHLNPVLHRLVAEIGDWRHSSFKSFPVLQQDYFRRYFADDAEYLKAHRSRGLSLEESETIENDLE